jgi:anti-sigma factor RsiW
MNVSRDVANDLLPLYVAGEASPDSCALVEEFLRSDPELARLAEALRGQDFPSPRGPSGPAPERLALERTRRLLRLRTWLLAPGIFFTAMPFSFLYDEGSVRYFMLRDAPAAASAFLLAAVALWIGFVITIRRLRVTGL